MELKICRDQNIFSVENVNFANMSEAVQATKLFFNEMVENDKVFARANNVSYDLDLTYNSSYAAYDKRFGYAEIFLSNDSYRRDCFEDLDVEYFPGELSISPDIGFETQQEVLNFFNQFFFELKKIAPECFDLVKDLERPLVFSSISAEDVRRKDTELKCYRDNKNFFVKEINVNNIDQAVQVAKEFFCEMMEIDKKYLADQALYKTNIAVFFNGVDYFGHVEVFLNRDSLKENVVMDEYGFYPTCRLIIAPNQFIFETEEELREFFRIFFSKLQAQFKQIQNF